MHLQIVFTTFTRAQHGSEPFESLHQMTTQYPFLPHKTMTMLNVWTASIGSLFLAEPSSATPTTIKQLGGHYCTPIPMFPPNEASAAQTCSRLLSTFIAACPLLLWWMRRNAPLHHEQHSLSFYSRPKHPAHCIMMRGKPTTEWKSSGCYEWCHAYWSECIIVIW